MSVDLDELFAVLRNEPAGLRLATPATVRAAGDRRKRVRRIGGVGAVAVVVAAGTAGGAYSIGAVSEATPSGTGHVSIAISTFAPPAPMQSTTAPAPSPSLSTTRSTKASSTTSPVSPPPPNTTGGACGRANLKAVPSTGQWNILVTVVNESPTPCTIRGFPGLVYTQKTGSTTTLPTTPRGPSNPSVTLSRSAKAAVNIAIDSGRPDTHVTDCSDPVTYQGISLVLDGGDRIPLPDLTIDAQCDIVSITSWSQGAT